MDQWIRESSEALFPRKIMSFIARQKFSGGDEETARVQGVTVSYEISRPGLELFGRNTRLISQS